MSVSWILAAVLICASDGITVQGGGCLHGLQADPSSTSDKIYYVKLQIERIPLDCHLGALFLDQPPDFGNDVNVFMRQIGQGIGQYLNLAFQTDVAIDDAMHLTFDAAKSAFDGKSAGAKALLGYGYVQFFRQVFEILINLLWFHGT